MRAAFQLVIIIKEANNFPIFTKPTWCIPIIDVGCQIVYIITYIRQVKVQNSKLSPSVPD